MSTSSRYRRVKRPTLLLTKRSQLAIQNLSKMRSYKPLCQKLKVNNHELAKLFSKVTLKNQDLVSLTITLSGELLELRAACNRRDEIVSGVLKNAKESQHHLSALSNHLSNIITSCQQVAKSTRSTLRKSASATIRESTGGRLSEKSPVRVAQVNDGHEITKSTILRRLNIRREYDNVASPPNLSDIDEVLTTPERSPLNVHRSTSPARSSIARRLNLNVEKLPGTPSRLHENDVDERRSNVRSKRNSARRSGHSLRRERESSNIAFARSNDSAMVHEGKHPGPRVMPRDSLPNFQSQNIRTSSDNSFHMDWTQSRQHELTNPIEISPSIRPKETTNGTTFQDSSGNSETIRCVDVSKIGKSQEKNEKNMSHNVMDLVEGTSCSAVAPSSSQRFTETSNETTQFALSRVQKKSVVNGNDDDDYDFSFGDASFTRRWAEHSEKFWRKINALDEDDRTNIKDMNFVTRRRSYTIDTNSFSLLGLSTATVLERNYHFGPDDLVFPVLESPIATATEIRSADCELDDPHDRCQQIFPVNSNSPCTTSVQQDKSDSLAWECEKSYTRKNKVINLVSESAPHSRKQRHSPSRINPVSRTTSAEQDEQSANISIPRKRKKAYKRIKINDSESDSESGD